MAEPPHASAKPDPRNVVHLVACGFGSGFAPRAPGTVGTLVGVALYLPLAQASLGIYLVACAAVIAIGIWTSGRTANDLHTRDHPAIVIDEIAGFFVTMTAIPFEWPWLLAGFVLFRVFDVLKPWPIRALDRHVHGGLGIMLDDLAAGAAACAVLHALVSLT